MVKRGTQQNALAFQASLCTVIKSFGWTVSAKCFFFFFQATYMISLVDMAFSLIFQIKLSSMFKYDLQAEH